MTTNEDCASVLEQFIHDVANLPAEISHMMEEIQAKDKEMQKFIAAINTKDGNLQKHVKLNGTLLPHPKEKEYHEAVTKNYELSRELQDQKIALSEKACHLLDRQLKKLDVKIRELQNDGQLLDGLPSIFNRKQVPDSQKAFGDMPIPSFTPLQATSSNALNMNVAAHRLNTQHHMSAHLAQPIPRQLAQINTVASASPRNPTPATPASALPHQRHRESSAGAMDPKRRKMTNSSFTANVPAQPSSLRQSSLGPGIVASGTPKAVTPTATSASGARSGSLPRSTATQPASAGVTKKSNLSKKVAPVQQINKLKGKALTKHARLSTSSAGRKKGVSPSIRSRGGGNSDDGDSVLSSADPSDTDSHSQANHRGRRGKKDAVQQAAAQQQKAAAIAADGDVPMQSDDGEDDDDDQEDDKRYCFCNERSYGEMVACENDKCPYEWFHLACIGMKKVPDEAEVWYCPECRQKPEIVGIMEVKDGKGRK